MPGRTPRVVVVNEAGSWILRVQAAGRHGRKGEGAAALHVEADVEKDPVHG
jgi:hypothetical protein